MAKNFAVPNSCRTFANKNSTKEKNSLMKLLPIIKEYVRPLPLKAIPPIRLAVVWREKLYEFHIVIKEKTIAWLAVGFLCGMFVTYLEPLRWVRESHPDWLISLGMAEIETQAQTQHLYIHPTSEFERAPVLAQKVAEDFIIAKQILISDALIENKVSRLDQLNSDKLLEINREIAQLFCKNILQTAQTPDKVYHFFTDSIALRKIETALMEQVKYNIPASITLSRSALETAFGSRVVGNNYFNIRHKKSDPNQEEDPELRLLSLYFSEPEALLFKDWIVRTEEELAQTQPKILKCLVQNDLESYPSAWASFRAHSEMLAADKRYAPLFTKGKKYEDWADLIGSAENVAYGEGLKQIIARYQLYLLDF